MATNSFQVTTSPESTACLYNQNTREGHAGCLASLASCRYVPQRLLNKKHGQRHRSARAQRPRVPNLPHVPPEFGFGNILGGNATKNATAVPSADTSEAPRA